MTEIHNSGPHGRDLSRSEKLADDVIIYGTIGVPTGLAISALSLAYRLLPEGTTRTIVESGHFGVEILTGIGAAALVGGLVKHGLDIRQDARESS